MPSTARPALAAFLAALFLSAPASAYPTRPIRMIVPNAPGSAIDTLGRIVALRVGAELGQQIIVDNRAGAGGVVGMELGARANPDGYTLIAASTAAISIAPAIYARLPYDPLASFEFVSTYAVTPLVMVVASNQPVKSVKEMIAWAKSRGAQLNFGSAGSGSQGHLGGIAFMAAAGIESTHVPYKGGGALVSAVVASESHWTMTGAPAVMALVAAGRLRALGHTLPKRTALLPDMPAIAETVPGFQYIGWHGLIVPRSTPAPVVERLRSALEQAGRAPELKEAFAQQGADIALTTPAAFRKSVVEEIAVTARIARAAGLKPD